jgi:GH24 family phage-related lysozyme (muramidase)
MPVFTLPNIVTEENLIDYDLFPIADRSITDDLVKIRDLEASEQLINFMLRQIKWRGYTYLDSDNQQKIGYNLTKDIQGNGLTEHQAYLYWIEDFKNKERQFKKIMVLDNMSQSQYDGMLSMYYFTGDYTSVGTETRKFKLFDDIKNRRWNYVATAMSNSGVNRTQRQLEAKIVMLGDYGVPKERILIKEQGLQEIVKNYPLNMLNDQARAQAEYVYFAETQRFLPKTSESRKRILARQMKN